MPGVGDGQGGLACCDSWGRKESDTTERRSKLGMPGEGEKKWNHERYFMLGIVAF